MPDYKSMYYKLFNRVSDAITILQTVQQECEDIFASGAEVDTLHIVEPKGKDAK
ncbi:MAG: hypothetical protein FWE19_09570 [Oscillospiraceae bacterium]|nr:hypothetical protein [Oscillospiraceae bacterium]